MDVLMAFLETNSYTPPSDGSYPFNNTIFAELVDADVGHPITADGEPLQTADTDAMEAEILESEPVRYATSSAYHPRYCVTDFDRFGDEVKLRDGDVVSVTDYDTVLVSTLWMYYAYVHYLTKTFPDLNVVGVQEESVQDPTSSSAELQRHNREMLDGLDGYVVVNEQYRQWVSAHVDEVLYQPLPIPDGQFDDIGSRSDAATTVCLGIGTGNLDFENYYSNFLVFERLRERDHDVDGEYVGIKPFQRDRIDAFVDESPAVDVTGYLNEGYYERLSQMALAVLLTTRGSTGRYAAEFASLGVPCIGTAINEYQAHCWPDLCVDPYDLETAEALAHRLLTDPAFYDEQVQQARDAVVDLFEKDAAARRLRDLLVAVDS